MLTYTLKMVPVAVAAMVLVAFADGASATQEQPQAGTTRCAAITQSLSSSGEQFLARNPNANVMDKGVRTNFPNVVSVNELKQLKRQMARSGNACTGMSS